MYGSRQTLRYSKVLCITTTITKLVTTVPSMLWAVVLTPSTANASIEIHDSSVDATGPVVMEMASTAANSIPFNLTVPIYCKNGLAIMLNGKGASAYIYFTDAS